LQNSAGLWRKRNNFNRKRSLGRDDLAGKNNLHKPTIVSKLKDLVALNNDLPSLEDLTWLDNLARLALFTWQDDLVRLDTLIRLGALAKLGNLLWLEKIAWRENMPQRDTLSRRDHLFLLENLTWLNRSIGLSAVPWLETLTRLTDGGLPNLTCVRAAAPALVCRLPGHPFLVSSAGCQLPR
jgi:hypothetical protein